MRKYRKIGENEDKGYKEITATIEDSRCPFCGSGEFHVNANMKREFKDVDENGNFRKVIIPYPRYKCRSCNSTWSPLPGDLVNSFTPEFRETVLEKFFTTEAGIKELAAEYHLLEQKLRKFIRDYLKEWKDRKKYRIPEHAGLVALDMKGGPYYALTDVRAGKLLDILDRKELEKLDFTGVEKVYLTDLGVPEEVLAKIHAGRIAAQKDIIENEALNALLADAKGLGIKGDSLKEILKNTEKIPYGEIIKTPGIIPLFNAAKSLGDILSGKKTPDKDLEHFNSLTRQLETFKSYTENPESVPEEYAVRAEKLRERAQAAPDKINSADRAMGWLVYPENPQPAVTDEDTGEILMDFGIRL